MINLKTQVENCLQKYPDSRNSDVRLTNTVWIEYYFNYLTRDKDGDLIVKLLDLYKLPKEDNIKRWRARFNSKGLYLPTDQKVIKQRRLLEVDWHEAMAPSNPSRG